MPIFNISPNEDTKTELAKKIAEEERARELAEAEELREELAQYTLEGKWDDVVGIYSSNPKAHTIKVNDSMDTALHVAVDLDEEDVVRKLLNEIIRHEGGPQETMKKSALEMVNEHGDTPLHVAASRGFAKLCKCIIGDNEERLDLRRLKNNQGETPLFGAALNGNKQAFAYLSQTRSDRITLPDLVRNDEDSILHCAIRREYFDLAVIIVHYFDFLGTLRNKDGFTPLKVLATRPSAFRSGIKFSWWKLILYHCILVEPLDVESTMRKILRKMQETESKEKFPKNYTTLCDFIGKFWPWEKDQHDTENPYSLARYHTGFLPPNYATIHQFIRSAYVHALGLSGVALKDVRKTKKKHQWSGQLLVALLQHPYEAFTGKGGDRPDPRDWDFEPDVYNLVLPVPRKQDETSNLPQEGEEPPSTPTMTDSRKGTPGRKDSKTKPEDGAKDQKGSTKDIDRKETPFLAAAKNGIVEMVIEIRRLIPSAIHSTNSKRENVVLVAVRNRQPHIVEALKMGSKEEVWNNLILAVDDKENTVLHLAAKEGEKSWHIAGSALQMMWDIKWYQYVKSIVPQHCYFRSNKDSETAGEIFKNSHEDLVQKGSEWLKETSESCSVVAALVAGVSFATASAVPGGTNDEGKPPLEGQPAFDAFAIASLIGLCFSVTGLIMFLAILTSRKEAKDFRRGLPLKLLLGLSSLFVSIIAMFVSFCSGHFFIINHKYKTFLFPFYVATSLPVAFYALAQFPLYFDLLTAIITKVPRASDKGDNF